MQRNLFHLSGSLSVSGHRQLNNSVIPLHSNEQLLFKENYNRWNEVKLTVSKWLVTLFSVLWEEVSDQWRCCSQSAGTLSAVLSSGWLVRLLHGEHCSAAASTVSQSTSEHTAGLSGHQGRCVITRDQADTLQSCQLCDFIRNIRCCVGVVWCDETRIKSHYSLFDNQRLQRETESLSVVNHKLQTSFFQLSVTTRLLRQDVLTEKLPCYCQKKKLRDWVCLPRWDFWYKTILL